MSGSAGLLMLESARRYWVELAIVVVAIAVVVAGFSANYPFVDASPNASTAPAAHLVEKRLPGNAVFSLDTVSAANAPITIGGMRRHVVPVPPLVPVAIQGWAVDAAAGAAASAVAARLDGLPDVVAVYGGDRGDVARALNNAQFERSGFTITLPGLKPGHHLVSLLVYARGGDGYRIASDVLDLDVK